ncbi:hypothetical protein [Leptolyngbya sp. FACHB-261]|uniref:hypothetical protein n=1 Tax=Leptolyngbya sp. FACHB-261 TaxID=2692806 RepID=UPI0016824658|nr:hypothetical protein [Leptolyngbya sp. FACHB-261]MBD2100133.1 hypothetical protein [Leptolyngbya sp. FACHB-261]
MLSSICAALEPALNLIEQFACRYEVWLDRENYRLYSLDQQPGLGLLVSSAADLWTPLGLVRSLLDQHLAGRILDRYILLSPLADDDLRLNYLVQFYCSLIENLKPWTMTCLSLEATPEQILAAQPQPLAAPQLPQELEAGGVVENLVIRNQGGDLFWILDQVALSGEEPVFTGVVPEAEAHSLAALGRLAAVEWAMAQFSKPMAAEGKLYSPSGRLKASQPQVARALRFANNAHWQLPVVRLT